MISRKLKAIFIHIPKTGGSSLENLIWPKHEARVEADLWGGFIDQYHNKYQTGGLQHLLGLQIRQEIGEKIFSEFFKFTMVRNPWDKAISQYKYTKKRTDLMSLLGMQKNDCLKTYLSLIQKREHVQWIPQHRFLLDENGDQLVDFIGRFENFESEVRRILRRLKIDAEEIPHDNQGKRRPLCEEYDEESVEMVRQIYHQDIELLSYQFG
jgi:hypothetical protein